MERTIERFGASLNLTLSGTPNELTREITRLYNYGIITNIPETFNEKEDTNVFVQSDAGRMERGFHSLACVSLQQNERVCKALKGKKGGFNTLAKEKAARYIAQFVPVETVSQKKASARVYGFGDTHEGIGWNNTTVS